jgi:hypothetical protein
LDEDDLGNDDVDRFRPPLAPAPESGLVWAARPWGLLVFRGAGIPSCASKSKLYGSSSSPPVLTPRPPPKKLAFGAPLDAVVVPRLPPPPPLLPLFVVVLR